MKIKIGDTVKWSSQAGGYSKEKQGTVVRIVTDEELKNGCTRPGIIASEEFPGHAHQLDGWTIPGSGTEAYFVEVITGPKAKPRLYMPYPSKLQRT